MFTVLILLVFVVTLCILLFLGQRVKVKSEFAAYSERTQHIYLAAVMTAFLYVLLFLFVFMTDRLHKIPQPWSDLYWISTGLCGIVFGFIGIQVPIKLIARCSVLQMTLGLVLMILFFFMTGVTSM